MINDERRIQKYSFKGRLKLIKAGFKILDENKKADDTDATPG